MSGKTNVQNQRKPATEDLRVVKTRKALHEALEKLMKEVDYSKITVTALAKEASINRKTFYSHYQSVDDLVAEVIAYDVERICEDALAATVSNERSELFAFETLSKLLLQAVDESFDQQLNLLQDLGFLKLAEMIIDPLEKVAVETRARLGLPEREGLRGEIACYAGCLLAGYAQWRIDAGGGETLDDVAARVNRMTIGFAQEALS